MSNAETTIRIQQMEQYMDAVSEALKKSPDTIKEDAELRRKVESLADYMDSGQWLADYEADERGELPADLKRGVLSQDGLYNLICEVKEREKRNMSEFTLNEMLEMQKTLQERYKTI